MMSGYLIFSNDLQLRNNLVECVIIGFSRHILDTNTGDTEIVF